MAVTASAFRPTGTISMSVGSVSVNARLLGGGDSVVVTNTTNSVVYVGFGADSSVKASTSDMPVLANSKLILSVNSLIANVAAISPAGSGTVLLSRGDGSFI